MRITATTDCILVLPLTLLLSPSLLSLSLPLTSIAFHLMLPSASMRTTHNSIGFILLPEASEKNEIYISQSLEVRKRKHIAFCLEISDPNMLAPISLTARVPAGERNGLADDLRFGAEFPNGKRGTFCHEYFLVCNQIINCGHIPLVKAPPVDSVLSLDELTCDEDLFDN